MQLPHAPLASGLDPPRDPLFKRGSRGAISAPGYSRSIIRVIEYVCCVCPSLCSQPEQCLCYPAELCATVREIVSPAVRLTVWV